MRVMVTGGTGFLGGHLIDALVERGFEVRALVRDSARGREQTQRLKKMGVTLYLGDLSDPALIAAAARDCEVVFHSAAIASDWGRYEDFYRVNVIGTKNVLKACQEVQIRRLVHVSSPSAVFEHKDQIDIDESTPYPKTFKDPYCATKAASEQDVLSANGIRGVTTTALRPHAIWGPRDTTILPRIADVVIRGRFAIIGNGQNRVSACYVSNAVDALILAAQKDAAAGNAYFITDDGSYNVWTFFEKLLQAAGLPGPKRSIPYPLVYTLGTLMEWAWKFLPLPGKPLVTRYGVAHIAKTTTYIIDRAKTDLGYVPKVGLEEGMEHLKKWIHEVGGIQNVIAMGA